MNFVFGTKAALVKNIFGLFSRIGFFLFLSLFHKNRFCVLSLIFFLKHKSTITYLNASFG